MHAQSNLKNITDLDQTICELAIKYDPKDGPGPVLCSSLASTIYIQHQDVRKRDVTMEDAITDYLKILYWHALQINSFQLELL